jgi:hypothetical protein
MQAAASTLDAPRGTCIRPARLAFLLRADPGSATAHDDGVKPALGTRHPPRRSLNDSLPRTEGKRDFSSLKDWRVSAVAGVVAGFVAGLLIFRWPGHLPPAWGDIPAWIGAIATIGLLIGAIYTARYAIKAFGTQSEQLEEQRKINTEQTAVLKLRAKELRESIDERRRAQVSRIVISAEPKPLEDKPIRSIEGTVHNTSQ